jgi:hypothetical protein
VWEVFGANDTAHSFMTAHVSGFAVADVRVSCEELARRDATVLTAAREFGGGAVSAYSEKPEELIDALRV